MADLARAAIQITNMKKSEIRWTLQH